MNFSLFESVAFAISAVFLFVIADLKKTHPALKVLLLTGLSLFLFATIAHLIADYFTSHGIDDSVIYHLVYGMKGAGLSEYSTLICLSIASLMTSVAFVIGISKASKYGVRSSWFAYLSLIPLITSLMIHPVAKLFFKQSNELTFTEKFEDYYREPIIHHSQIANRKNLVFIYAEGLERTWLDVELFPGITPNLNRLRESAADFTNIRAMPYTGWTIAGIVATQCGLPLVISSNGNGMSGVDAFLPGAICLSEILKAHGYQLEFNGGADLDFAGKGNFFRTHGFDSVNGRTELIELIDPEFLSGWGVYDDDLMDFNFHRFEELSATGNPFALFTLTLDTHHPKGIPSKSCTGSGLALEDTETTMHFAVKCSDLLISNFIQKIRQSPYAEQTLVVVVSDHLAMNNIATRFLARGDRKDLFMVLPGWEIAHGQINKPGSILDIGATTLGFLGIETSIGFGRDLRMEESAFATDQIDANLFKSWSDHFSTFWAYPNLGEGIVSNSMEETLTIGNAKVRIPVLIQFDSKLNTQLVFDDFAGSPTGILDKVYRKLSLGTPFAYIAECWKFSDATDVQRNREKCLLLGRKGYQNNRLLYINDLTWVGKEEFIRVIHQEELFD